MNSEQISLTLRPQNAQLRTRIYIFYMVSWALVAIACVLYSFLLRSPKLWVVLPFICSIYSFGAGLKGASLIRSTVAFLDKERFVSVNWRGTVSAVRLTGIRKVQRSNFGLRFTDRWQKSWSGYLGGASELGRDAFIKELGAKLRADFPAIELIDF